MFATAVALLLLTWAHSRVDATTAAVVLTLEPVFRALLALFAVFAVIAGEILDRATVVGAVAVLSVAVLASRSAATPQPAGQRPVWESA